MKISCPSCAAKYSVADEKIQARLAKIRCRKCSATIVIDGTATPANVYVADGTPQESTSSAPASSPPASAGEAEPPGSEGTGPAPGEYAVDIADNDQRNMSVEQIVAAYNEGVITGDTYVWREGMADWQTLGEVPEVADALHAAAASAAAEPAQAAVRGVPAGQSTDLFGGIEQAGGEDDITTSAPEPTPAVTAGTGARNESSVLFSLSALTSTQGAAEQAAAPAAQNKTSEDSGLIDLQALTAADSGASPGGLGASPTGAFGASPLISAPLGGVSGPAMGASLAPGYERRSSRTGLMLAGGLLAVGILAGAAFLVKSGGDDSSASTLGKTAQASPEAAGEPTTNQAAAAVAPPTTAVEPEEEAAPEPEPEPEAVPAPVAKKPVVKRRTRSTAKKRRKKKPKPKPASKPAPKKASKPAAKPQAKKKKKRRKKKPGCNCKPADLMCAMKCSAGK